MAVLGGGGKRQPTRDNVRKSVPSMNNNLCKNEPISARALTNRKNSQIWAIERYRLEISYPKTFGADTAVFVAFKVLDPRAGIENDHVFARRDFAGVAKQFESCETRSSFWADENALRRSHFARAADHFFIINSNGATIGLTKNVQDQEISNRFRNTQTGGKGARVGKFRRNFFSGFECADDRCATAGLHREHARPLFADPAEGFHFVERFPHSDKPSAAARGIKNHVGQLPCALLRSFV